MFSFRTTGNRAVRTVRSRCANYMRVNSTNLLTIRFGYDDMHVWQIQMAVWLILRFTNPMVDQSSRSVVRKVLAQNPKASRATLPIQGLSANTCPRYHEARGLPFGECLRSRPTISEGRPAPNPARPAWVLDAEQRRLGRISVSHPRSCLGLRR